MDLTGSHPQFTAQQYQLLNVIPDSLEHAPLALISQPDIGAKLHCTDPFAEALQRARLTGIAFYDPETGIERPAPPLLPGDPGSGFGGSASSI